MGQFGQEWRIVIGRLVFLHEIGQEFLTHLRKQRRMAAMIAYEAAYQAVPCLIGVQAAQHGKTAAYETLDVVVDQTPVDLQAPFFYLWRNSVVGIAKMRRHLHLALAHTCRRCGLRH